MCAINIKATILESDDEISRLIMKALLPEINSSLNSAFYKIKERLLLLVQTAITSSPEYTSIMSGQLKYEFGLPDSAARLSEILTFWKYINVEYNRAKINGTRLSGSISISMIKSDYSDVLSSAAAILQTEKGADLQWLSWLLLFGDKTIIKTHNVVLGPSPVSRTGGAIMKASSSGKWGVPSEFSGTANNNWITRAIDSVSQDIDSLLMKALG